MADLLLRLIGENSASGAFDSVGNSMKILAGEAVKFAQESIKAYQEQERADRQLQRVAGELTETFKAQASAMQAQLGVSDDMVEGIQTMLLRFGEAPANVEATTRAILDYSAATGEDAVSATHALLAGVQSGKQVFKDLGLEYNHTGLAAQDLTNVTAALSKKLGGAAAAEGGSLAGETAKAKQQFGELQETFGELISDFAKQTNIVVHLKDVIQDLNQGIRFMTGKGDGSIPELVLQLQTATKELEGLHTKSSQMAPGLRDSMIEAKTKEVERLQAALVQAGLAQMALATGGRGSTLPTQGTDRTTGRDTPGKLDAELKNLKTDQQQIDEFWKDEDEKDAQRELDNENRKIESINHYFDAVASAERDGQRAEAKRQEEWEEHNAEIAKKRQEEAEKLDAELVARSQKMSRDLHEAMRAENEKFEADMSSAGMKIGQALGAALVNAIEAEMDGGEFDVLGAVADVAFAVGAVAAQAIATAYGNPALGEALGVGIAAIGGLEHHARASAWKSEQAAKKKHEGGWIDSYHSGGWPGLSSEEEMIVAQQGERVLSRQEVRRMGGSAGVDMAARGGGGGRGLTVYISAMDTQSVMEGFQDKTGRGLFNALRTGRGPLNAVFDQVG